MGTLDVVQVAFVQPMISALRDAGVPVKRFLRTSKLDRFSLHHLDIFVPAPCVREFFNLVAKHEMGPDIPPEILANYRLANKGKWHLSPNPENQPQNQGFDEWRLGF